MQHISSRVGKTVGKRGEKKEISGLELGFWLLSGTRTVTTGLVGIIRCEMIAAMQVQQRRGDVPSPAPRGSSVWGKPKQCHSALLGLSIPCTGPKAQKRGSKLYGNSSLFPAIGVLSGTARSLHGHAGGTSSLHRSPFSTELSLHLL